MQHTLIFICIGPDGLAVSVDIHLSEGGKGGRRRIMISQCKPPLFSHIPSPSEREGRKVMQQTVEFQESQFP